MNKFTAVEKFNSFNPDFFKDSKKYKKSPANFSLYLPNLFLLIQTERAYILSEMLIYPLLIRKHLKG